MDDSILIQVRVALDEFEIQHLEVSTRRAYRIARARGDSRVAHRLLLELSFGAPAGDRWRTVAAIHEEDDPEILKKAHSAVGEEWIASRRLSQSEKESDDSPNLLACSVPEMRAQLENLERQYERAAAKEDWESLNILLPGVIERREIMERTRQWIFEDLVDTETQLTSSDVVSRTFGRHRLSVDELLDAEVPAVRDQLSAALRVAEGGDAESRAQVLVTCRRILVAIADRLYPASDEPHISSNGIQHEVGQSNYRNRIMARAETTVDKAAGAAFSELSARLEALDDLVNKGIHADVSNAEMEFGLAQTYLLAGEMLSRVR